MKLRQIEFLCMLKEFGSISKVAEAAYTTQPTVSIAIKELEKELGFTLLRRTNRGIQFTEQGELALEQAQLIIQALDKISHIPSTENGTPTGSLRVGGLHHLCNSLLLNAQTELQDLYPNFTLHLHRSETHTLIKMVERDMLDLAIIQDCEVVDDRLFHPESDKSVFFHPLFRDELTFMAADEHPLLGRKDLTLDVLRAFPFAVFGDGVNRCVLTLTEEMGYPSSIKRFYEMVTMRKYMRDHHAVTVLPRKAVEHGNQNYQIKFFPLPLDGLSWTTQVGWIHRGKTLSLPERLVIENLQQQCSKPDFLSLL